MRAPLKRVTSVSKQHQYEIDYHKTRNSSESETQPTDATDGMRARVCVPGVPLARTPANWSRRITATVQADKHEHRARPKLMYVRFCGIDCSPVLKCGGNYGGRNKTSARRPSSPKLSKRRPRRKSLDDYGYVRTILVSWPMLLLVDIRCGNGNNGQRG